MDTFANALRAIRAWLPPWRVVLVAESSIVATMLLLLAVQDELRDWREARALFAISQPLLIPALSLVSRSAGDDSVGTLVLRLWSRTLAAGFALSVVVFTIAAATTESVAAGLGMFIMGTLVGGVMLTIMTALFAPALWLTARAIRRHRA